MLVVVTGWLSALVVHERPTADLHRVRPCATQACEASHAPLEACGPSCGHPVHTPIVAAVVAGLVIVVVRLASSSSLVSAIDRRRHARLHRPPRLAFA